MTDRSWLTLYPPGLPADLPPLADASLVSLFERSCRRFADLPALDNLGTTLTYRDWDRLSLRFAHGLHRLGLGPGHRLAIMLPNLLQYPIALLGALRAGLTAVNVNPLFTPRELAQELKDAEVSAIVLLANFGHVLEKARSDFGLKLPHMLVTQAGDLCPAPKRQLINWTLKYLKRQVPPFNLPRSLSWNQVIREGRERPLKVSLQPEDMAFLQYTGGTTGTPKGAILSHANVLANIEQTRLWLTCPEWPRYLEDGCERLITALPLYHIFALTTNLWVGMAAGVHNHLVTNPRDLKGLVNIINQSRCSCITGVNTLFSHLLHFPGFEQADFSGLKFTLAGGMPMQKSVAECWQEVTRCPVLEGYGLTEASPVVTLNPMNSDAFTGSIGLPLPGTDCQIVNDGRPVPPEKTGELWVRGPQVIAGYWNRPDETRAVLEADGWLRTGDIAKMDARGFFYIVDRKKDMILISGFNVYPHEIEEVVGGHPKVQECAAIGIPDAHTGEAVKLFVVKADASLTIDELQAWCRANLTAYKRPHHFEFRTELPKSPVGKILRHRLQG
ncbi:AMP-binding protein [Methylohalobius crimeensis]|uniref:AMP-binding protein n=1 Tax=Methylohalobius crimeensis TaxID=244365 RepID=UPI0003B556E0|nr:AMP-binding protein [Methylohalobius crimeensis]